jgi:hypothetical protein
MFALLLEDDPKSVIENKVLGFWWVIIKSRGKLKDDFTFIFHFDTYFVDLNFDRFINCRKGIVCEFGVQKWNFLYLKDFSGVIKINLWHLKPVNTIQRLQMLFLPRIDLLDCLSH